MQHNQSNRRKFLKNIAASTAGLAVLPAFTTAVTAAPEHLLLAAADQPANYTGPTRIKFSVIGINHGHINAMVEAVTRGGGEFVSFYAAEAPLREAFAKKISAGKDSRQ